MALIEAMREYKSSIHLFISESMMALGVALLPQCWRRASQTIALIIASVALFVPQDAHATFGDCNDTGYVETFDRRLEADPFGCIERMRVAVSTNDGTRHIRVVEGFAADWSYEPGYPEAVEAGVNAAAEALAEIGDFRMDDVTLLIIDDLPGFTPEERDESHALGMADVPDDDECRVALFPLARTGTDHVAFTVAHELFHCVQLATAGRERVLTLTRDDEGGGDWWVEGSAEWFSEFAIPGTDELDDRVATFDVLSINTPVHDMTYEAVILYLWLAEEKGAQAVVDSFGDMAESPSTDDQRAAMARMMDDEEWLSFTKAYLDEDIVDPAGNPIDSERVAFQETIDEPRRLPDRTLEPFVLERWALEFLCGRWKLEVSPGDSNVQSRERGAEWDTPPPSINAERDDDSDYLFAAINTDTDELEFALDVGVEASCEPCGEVDEIDQCLVGPWRRTGGGGMEWVRRQLPADMSIPRFEESGIAFVFRADGTYLTQRYNAEMSYRHRTVDGIVRGEGSITSQTSGRWSASDGNLVICPDSESVSGGVTMTMPEGVTLSAPIPNRGPTGPQEMDYSCSETSFETRMTFPTSPDPLTTSYSAVETPDETETEGTLIEIGDW